jgi:hypothetical protein
MTLYDEIKDQLKDSFGKYRTNSLFLEPLYDDSHGAPIFTLKEYDHVHKGRKLISLQQVYLKIADPTEYKFAMEVFGSWDHWARIAKNATISPYIEKWREELELKLRSLSVLNIIEVASAPDTKNLPAMKFVAEGGWKIAKRGRISKEDKEAEVRKEAGIAKSIQDDIKRIRAVK